MVDLKGLEESYRFYQKVKNDENSIKCGCYNDAIDWIFEELAKLFEKEVKDA